MWPVECLQTVNRIIKAFRVFIALQWRHNVRDGVSNHQPHDCLLDRLFRRRSRETSKIRVTSLCAGNWPVTGEFPAQRASNAENVSIFTYQKLWNKCWKKSENTYTRGISIPQLRWWGTCSLFAMKLMSYSSHDDLKEYPRWSIDNNLH